MTNMHSLSLNHTLHIKQNHIKHSDNAYLSLTMVNDKYAQQGVLRQVSAVPLRDLVNDKYAGQ